MLSNCESEWGHVIHEWMSVVSNGLSGLYRPVLYAIL